MGNEYHLHPKGEYSRNKIFLGILGIKFYYCPVGFFRFLIESWGVKIRI